jgi:hypothetical protein
MHCSGLWQRCPAGFPGSASSHFIATTVELLTTGVDVPGVRNIAFFRYMKSPIWLHVAPQDSTGK